MNVTQVYQFVNAATKETLGENAVVNEDLSNIVDVGVAINTAVNGVDNYVRALTNHIGKVVFDNRRLDTAVPSIVRDAWEWGSILEKVHMALPEAGENETWSLVDGQTYNQDKFYQPKVYTKFFNKRVTFEIDLSITEKQVKESFSNAAQAAAFVAMIYNAIDQSMVIKLDDLILRTINNFIGETIHDDNGANLRAVNLLSLYNTLFTPITVAEALYTADFLRFAAKIIKQYIRRMRRPSTLFNMGGTKKFTPADRMNVVMLGEFASAAEIYLYNGAGQFLVNNIQLPNADTVEYWQGTGTDYGFTSASAIDIVTTEGHTVQQSGILCCVFDRDALGVANLDRRTRTHVNDKAEFVNNFVKADAGYWNDFNENFVVFYIGT